MVYTVSLVVHIYATTVHGCPDGNPEVNNFNFYQRHLQPLCIGELPEDQPLPRRILPPTVHALNLIPQCILVHAVDRIFRPVQRDSLAFRDFQRCLVLSPIK